MKKCGLSGTTEWRAMLGYLFQYGEEISPRGKKTKEIINYTSTVDMLGERPIVLAKDRKLSYNFMAAEAHTILSGSNKVDDLIKYAPSYKNYSDGGVFLQGAYGPKVTEQIQYVVECLREDPDSRQAVICIWREMPRKSKDIPCTLTLQFLLRDSQVDCIANMRSSDAWLGWPYDVFTFSMVTWYICLEINKTPGTLHLNAGSQHIYEENWERAHTLMLTEENDNNIEEYGDIFNLDYTTMVWPRDLVDALGTLKDTVLI